MKGKQNPKLHIQWIIIVKFILYAQTEKKSTDNMQINGTDIDMDGL